MLENAPSSQPNKIIRREEHSLVLNELDEQMLSKRLRDTGDELSIFSPATRHLRIVNDVNLIPEEGSKLPASSSKLEFATRTDKNGTYQTVLKLAGYGFVHAGSGPDGMGFWRTFRGRSEQTPISHAGLLQYLRPRLAKTRFIDQLTDSSIDIASCSNEDMVEALWNDFIGLSDKWKNIHMYHSNETAFFEAADGLKSAHIANLSGDSEDDYSSVISIVDTPHARTHRLRIGSALPIVITEADVDDENSLEVTPFCGKSSSIGVDQEFSLAVEVPHKRTDENLRMMAALALASSDLPGKRLQALTQNVALSSFGNTENIVKSYQDAIDMVAKQHNVLS